MSHEMFIGKFSNFHFFQNVTVVKKYILCSWDYLIFNLELPDIRISNKISKIPKTFRLSVLKFEFLDTEPKTLWRLSRHRTTFVTAEMLNFRPKWKHHSTLSSIVILFTIVIWIKRIEEGRLEIILVAWWDCVWERNCTTAVLNC